MSLAYSLAYILTDKILVNFGRDLNVEFKRSNIEFVISQPKVVRLLQNEKQTYRLSSMRQMWPPGLTLATTLTLTFQGQILNLLYLMTNDPVATKQKMNVSIER